MSSPFTSILGFKELSEVTGMTIASLSTTLNRARARRKEGKFFDTDMPEPDTRIGASPVWSEDTVLKWLTARAAKDSKIRILNQVDPVKSLARRTPVPLKRHAKKGAPKSAKSTSTPKA